MAQRHETDGRTPPGKKLVSHGEATGRELESAQVDERRTRESSSAPIVSPGVEGGESLGFRSPACADPCLHASGNYGVPGLTVLPIPMPLSGEPRITGTSARTNPNYRRAKLASTAMSGPADERWRGGRSYDQNRQSSQRHSNSRNMNSRGGQNSNVSNNYWAESQPSTSVSQEPHVPAGGFNAAEAKAALKKGPGAPKPFFYRLQGKDATNRGNGPWGSKANAMANGKDFFTELRKQVTTLRQGGPVAGG